MNLIFKHLIFDNKMSNLSYGAQITIEKPWMAHIKSKFCKGQIKIGRNVKVNFAIIASDI